MTSSGKISGPRTVAAFASGRACSDTLFHVLGRAHGYPMEREEKAAVVFAGGLLQHGFQCGMVWGAALAAGAQAYRSLGPGPRAEAAAVAAAGRLVDSFRSLHGHVNCLEITGIDQSSSKRQMVTYFLLKGGTIGCFRMAARFAPIALAQIDGALADGAVEVPPAPASCAALLARRVGASEMHAVMAAGWAGGVGLHGGACGALGTALWLLGLRRAGGGSGDKKSADARAVIDRFVTCADYELECTAIVGRRFAGLGDHADYLRGGGCAKIFEALAAAG